MMFVLSAASSAMLLFLTVLWSAPPAAVVTAFEVDPDKAGFLDGSGGIKEKEGTTEDGATTRIVGGDIANKTRFPYFTALFRGDNDTFDKDSLFCGGSLIRPDVVITAAYCATSEQDHGVPIKVAVNFTDYVDQSYAHKRNVIEVVIHQASETSDVYYSFSDIALLFLDSPITTEVTPIQLNIEAGVPTDGQVLKAIGIGVTNAERNNYSDNLMEVDLPKVDDNSCKEIWFDIEEYAVDTTTMVCAGYPEGGKSTCVRDLGGPLVIPGDSHKNDVLVGISSYFSVDCSELGGVPGVNTRISAFIEWIEGSISCVGLGACTSSPTTSPSVSISPTVSVSPTLPPTVAPTPPTPQYMPGPTVNIVVSLQTDEHPKQSSLWYRNVCNGNLTILLDIINDLAPNEIKNFSVVLTTGINEFVLSDFKRDGIKNGSWSVIDASNMILYQNDEFIDGISDKSGLIIVGDKDSTKCPDVLLPGPNATANILLSTDYFPEETSSLGYQNLCNGVKTQINSSLATEKYTQYNFPVELSTGEYEFYIRDSIGDGLNDGNLGGSWSVVLTGNLTLYENLRFVGKEDKSGSHLVVGSGCGSTRPAATTTSSSSVVVTKKTTMLSQTAAFLWIAIVAFW